MPKPVTRKHLRPPYDPCRSCSVCDGMSHHWLEGCNDADPPTYSHICKHCDAVGIFCDDCDGDGCDDEEGEGLCTTCKGEGVCFVATRPACSWCDRRIPTPQEAWAGEENEVFCSRQCRTAHAEAIAAGGNAHA